MGYTHNWTPEVVTKEKFAEFSKVCKELYNELPNTSETAGGCFSDEPIEIRGGMGEGKPLFRNDEVWFNGNREKDLDHETFCLTPNKTDWNFCKTARKPYDLLVCACLIVAHEKLGYEVDSDGNFEDWLPAIEFYSEVIYGTKKKVMAMNKDCRKAILPKFLYDESVDYKREQRRKK